MAIEHDATARRPGGHGSDRGRPRDPSVDGAIVAAALAVLADRGYASMTMGEVAQRAGVSKPVIYRRWADKAQLIVEAIASTMKPLPGAPTDDVATAMLAYVNVLVTTFTQTPAGNVLPGLVAAMSGDPSLAARYRELLVEPMRRQLRTALEVGVRRGQLASHTDIDLVVDALAGPVYVRLLITGQPLDARLAADTVALVLARYGSPSAL